MSPIVTVTAGLALVAGFAIGVGVDHHFNSEPDLSHLTFALQPPPAVNSEHPCTVTRDDHDNIGYSWCDFSKAQDYPLDMLPAERGKLRCDDNGTGTPTLFIHSIDVGRVRGFDYHEYTINAEHNSFNQMQPGPWTVDIDCVPKSQKGDFKFKGIEGTAEPKP